MIQLVGVSKSFGYSSPTIQAVADVSLNINRGEFLSLIGPSGCGKSSILNMIGGLLKPTKGDILIESEPVQGPVPSKVAYMFQESTLLPWRNVLRNVTFGLEIQGTAREKREKLATEYLNMVGMSNWATSKPAALSGGMKQRISLARALASETPILLLDEPFGALDEQTRRILGDQLVDVWRKTGKTIVLVTHSLDEAVYMSDRVITLSSRPSHILDTFAINIQRPRKHESTEVSEIRERLWSILSTQVSI